MHVVVPDGWADPAWPSGGNTYDQEVCSGLERRGRDVVVHEVSGSWPGRGPASRDTLGAALAGIPDGALVLLDGLVASARPDVLVPEARRLGLVVLVHLPLGCAAASPGPWRGAIRGRERAALQAAARVVATSRWTRSWLLTAYGLAPGQVRVVPPGARPARSLPAGTRGDRLLCVGAVTPTKGQDVLVAALAEVGDLAWTCRCVGSTAVDPDFADGLRSRVAAAGLDDRLHLDGPLTRPELDRVYSATDLVVAPSRTETYGMVVTEALARGMPVVGSDVGGLPEALGVAPGGGRPGLLVAPADPGALAAALRRWLTDPSCRAALRRAAQERRALLDDWSVTTAGVARVLSEVAAEVAA